jgi:hypothetical protein
LKRYWYYQDLIAKFVERLHARGHSIENLSQILLQAAASLDNPHQRNNSNKSDINNDEETLDIPSKGPAMAGHTSTIRLYLKAAHPLRKIERMIVAVSRPRKLRDVLARAELTLPEVSTYRTSSRNTNTTPANPNTTSKLQ